MAAALITRTPQRLLSILEAPNEDRSSSLASSQSSREDARLRGGARSHAAARTGRLQQILDQPTFGREEELGRADSPRTYQIHEAAQQLEQQSDKILHEHVLQQPGPTEAVVEMYAAAMALKEVAQAKGKVDRMLLRTPIVVGQTPDSEHRTLASALKDVRRGTQAVIYLTDEVYHETGPLSIVGDVKLQPDPGSTSMPRIVLTTSAVGIQFSHASSVLHAVDVSFEQAAPTRVGVKPIEMVSKPLVHPPVGGHAAQAAGFGAASPLQSRCFQVARGRLLLERCRVRSIAGDGVVVGGDGRADIDGGEVSRCGRHGVSVADGGRTALCGLAVARNTCCGVVVCGVGSEASLERCSVVGCGWSGAVVDEGGQLRVRGGSVSRHGHAGVHVQDAASTAHVAACAVGHNRKHGVSVDASRRQRAEGGGECDALQQMQGQALAKPRVVRGHAGGPSVTVTDSQLKSNGKCGVRVKGSLAVCEATDCRVEDSAEEGVSAREGGVVVGNGCTITRNRRAGALAEGRGACVHLAKCTVTNGDYGVVAHEGQVKLHRCRVAMNLRADREERGAGRVIDVNYADGDDQWIDHAGGRPPTMMAPPPWLANMPKTNNMRTWHGF